MRQEGQLGGTGYSVVDAKRSLAGFAVGVRLAWPHLKANASDYDQQIATILRWVLDSVHEHVGPYEAREGEVIRRPTE